MREGERKGGEEEEKDGPCKVDSKVLMMIMTMVEENIDHQWPACIHEEIKTKSNPALYFRSKSSHSVFECNEGCFDIETTTKYAMMSQCKHECLLLWFHKKN